MIGSYAATAVLAGAGAPDRARTRPWLPLALAGKAAFDVATNARLAREEWAENGALCAWCQAANVASLAIAALSVPEASRAAGRLMASDAPSDPAGDAPVQDGAGTSAEDLLDMALEETFPASDPPAFTGSTLPKTGMASSA